MIWSVTGRVMTVLLALLYISAIFFVGTFLFMIVDWLEPIPLAFYVAAIAHQIFRSAMGVGP